MDPSEGDAIWWYQDMRYPQVFRALTGCQQDPRVLGRYIDTSTLHQIILNLRYSVRIFSVIVKMAKHRCEYCSL